VTLILIAAIALAQAAPSNEEAAYRDCVALVKKDAEKAVATASSWRLNGGGSLARVCLGMAYSQLGRWAPAATAFDQAARAGEVAQDPRRADFWVQSGNAWLAADDPTKAVSAFDAALATTSLTPELRGEVHLDRARAQVALGKLQPARTDIDKGLQLVGRDPFAWYLSAALAIREGNMARAAADAAKSVELAPDDPDVLLNAGTIAGTVGDVALARQRYAQVAKLAPNSEAGRAAQAALVANSQPEAPAEPAEDPADDE
jgi:tetratricopeptide (TPR) repeat protein